jgi:predicted ABC-type ATPase
LALLEQYASPTVHQIGIGARGNKSRGTNPRYAGDGTFSPETAAFRAGKMMLSEIQLFAKRRLSFAFETTLSGRSHMGLLRRLKAQGYEVHLFFLWVESVDLALSTVRERVLRGGHDVPEPVVRRRFDRSIRNFLVHDRQLADFWTLFDNSGATSRVVAFEKNAEVRIMDKSLYSALVKRYRRTCASLQSRYCGCPIEKRAEIAFKAAVAKAIDEHARLGFPIYIGRDGKVVELSADEVRDLSRSTQGK